MKLSTIREFVEIKRIDPEEDWEAAEAVEQAFRASKIGISRFKQVTLAAFENGEPIGGVLSAWEHDYDRDVWAFDFDVAVMPGRRGAGREHRGLGSSGVMDTAGIRLVLAAIQQYESEKHDHGDRTMISVYVVNPKLARFLQTRLGFELESEYGHGTVQLVRY
jgi:hypothetical protein